MNRVLAFIGLITCLFGLYFGVNYVYVNYHTLTINFFFYFGIIAFINVIILTSLILYYGRNWIIGSGKDILIGSDLISTINQTLNELPNPSKPTLSKLGGHLVYRFTRLGIIGLFLASIPIWLLWQQNQKIDIQNDKINIQNSLIEAERRSSLVFLMSNVLDKVDDEIKEQQKELQNQNIIVTDSTKYSLSKPLINRIVALSKTFKPYKMLSGDTLSSKTISPERGQLFTALILNNLDSITQNTIVEKGDFSWAVIGKIHLKNARFSRANLSGADLHDADFNGTNLSRANLHKTNLNGANLSGAHLNDAGLSFANLHNADLHDANFSGADLRKASFYKANLNETNLSDADLSFADFRDAGLNGANLSDVNLHKANFSGADLHKTILNNANIHGADFSGVDFLNARNLTKKQLLSLSSLYLCKNLNPEIKKELQKQKPCLFTEGGCR